MNARRHTRSAWAILPAFAKVAIAAAIPVVLAAGLTALVWATRVEPRLSALEKEVATKAAKSDLAPIEANQRLIIQHLLERRSTPSALILR